MSKLKDGIGNDAPLRRVFWFSVVGVVTFVIPLVISLAARRIGFSDQAAFALASVIAIEMNFFLNHVLTWRGHGSGLARSFLNFHLLKALTFLVGQGLFWGFSGLPELSGNSDIGFVISYVLTVGVMSLLNFVGMHRFVFRAIGMTETRTSQSAQDRSD